MAATNFWGRVRYRRATAPEWAAQDPILLDGEPGWDSTNKQLKIGDGVKRWSILGVFSGGGGGGGSGAVASVAGKVGAVVLDLADIAETTALKIMTATERSKLSGIATSATANSTDAQLRDRTTHTGIMPLTGVAAGALLVCPLNGSINTSASTARPSSRTDIFFTWRSTVQPLNMITGDEWQVPS